jgi:hypothetical protein
MALARSAHPRDFTSTPTSATPGQESAPSARPSFWQRFFAAMIVSRQRQAEREIALYLHDIGGKFTDDAEREIERRFLGPTRW